MPHLDSVVLMPHSSPSEVLFPVRLRAVAGKPLVCMVPPDSRWESLVLPDVVRGRYQPDVGVVADAAGCDGLSVGQFVALKPYTGAWFTCRDLNWIPEGRELRILGTADPWDENVLAVLEGL